MAMTGGIYRCQSFCVFVSDCCFGLVALGIFILGHASRRYGCGSERDNPDLSFASRRHSVGPQEAAVMGTTCTVIFLRPPTRTSDFKIRTMMEVRQ
jgi:hypothetical protein